MKNTILPSGQGRSGRISTSIWYDWDTATIKCHMTFKAHNGEMYAITTKGPVTFSEGDIVPLLFCLTASTQEDFPGILESVYQALGEYLKEDQRGRT